MKKHLARSLVFLVPILIFSLPFLLTRCGQSGPAAGTFGDVYTNIIAPSNCIPCHTPGTGIANTTNGIKLDLSTQANAYTGLTTLNSTDNSYSGCSTVALVAKGNPANSYFAAVLIPKYNVSNFAGVSTCTPFGHTQTVANLTTAQQNSIVTWITNNAPNN